MSALIQITDGAIIYSQAETDPIPEGFHKLEPEKKAKKEKKVEEKETKEKKKKG